MYNELQLKGKPRLVGVKHFLLSAALLVRNNTLYMTRQRQLQATVTASSPPPLAREQHVLNLVQHCVDQIVSMKYISNAAAEVLVRNRSVRSQEPDLTWYKVRGALSQLDLTLPRYYVPAVRCGVSVRLNQLLTGLVQHKFYGHLFDYSNKQGALVFKFSFDAFWESYKILKGNHVRMSAVAAYVSPLSASSECINSSRHVHTAMLWRASDPKDILAESQLRDGRYCATKYQSDYRVLTCVAPKFLILNLVQHCVDQIVSMK